MADSSAKSTNKKKKRNLLSLDDKPETPKKHRNDGLEERQDVEEERNDVEGGESSKQKGFDHPTEAGLPWRNLQLILSLHNKEIDLQKKIELAFDYVNSRAKEGANEGEEDYETVKVSRLVVFLNDWVQSLLFATDKKIRIKSGLVEGYLDYRCWVIFKFCLEESLRLRVLLSLSKDLLRAFGFIASNALFLLTETSSNSKYFAFTGDEFKLYSVVLDCVSLVFLSHGGLSNENLDLWISTVSAILKLVTKFFDEKLESGNAGTFALRFSCLVLEPFAKFLRVHPARKNGFRDFVDKLVEPLLCLLGFLHLHSNDSNTAWTGSLLTVVQEVLSQGLFHSVHIDGFLSLHSVEKYSPSNDGKVKDLKTVIKSYHRHFFDILERVVASKKEFELIGLAELFHLLVDRVRKQRTVSKGERTEGSEDLSFHSSKILNQINVAPSGNSYGSSHLTAEKRKSLFDFFVQIMEPLLHEMDGYCQSKLQLGPQLLDAHCTVKSINHLLATLFQEKLYMKTEDFSEGACLNFLKKVCNTIFSFSAYLYSLPTHDTDGKMQEIIISLAKQLVVAIQYFVGIEYDILENDLSSLWVMVLSYLALGHSLKDVSNQCLLTSQAVGLGCQLVNLYSELRQVESIIFALCKAIRCIMVHENDGYCEKTCGSFGSFTNLFPSEAYAKSVRMLLCEHEFKLAVSNGIKSLPEGQASECVRQLTVDLSESIKWMKNNCSVTDGKEYQESNSRKHAVLSFDLQTELFGGGLSELYALVLDSLTVTVGNSSLLGRSVRDLIVVLSPSMSILAGRQPDSVSKFLFFVTGKTSDKEDGGNKHILTNFGACTHWIFVFFFRLYISCRSLCRQATTFMPPDKSRMISADMLDFSTAYSGKDLIERTEWINEEYFSSVMQPSASLLVVIQSVSDICVHGSNLDYCPLIYVLHVMALQRIVDLNRQIKSLEYILQRITRIIQAESLDDASLSKCSKRSRKWARRLLALKEEAEGLAEFLTSYLSLLGIDKMSVCSTDDETCLATSVQVMDESHKWDLSVCSVNMDSLPTSIWWVVCQNVDVWSLHASKKKLKMFLSCVIRTCLPFISSGCTNGESYRIDETGFLNKINVHQISYDLLTNSILYEHDFVHRLLSSTFCRLLKKSVSSLFSEISLGNLDLNSSPDWQEILSTVGSLPMAVSGSQPVIYDKQLEGKPISPLQFKLPADMPVESAGLKFTACQSLLSLLCWIPKGYMNSKSFSLYVTYLLNLERCVISSLLECRDALSLNCQYQLLRLLVSCRRTLKGIIKGFGEEKTRTFQSSIIPVLSEDLHAVMWLFKSVNIVVVLQEVLAKDGADGVSERICSLMDHTSHVFLTLSKHYFNSAYEHYASNESDSGLDSFENSKGWKNVLLVAESLKDQTKGILIFMKDALSNEKEGNRVNIVNMELLSSIISCFSGFLWGLASALNYINTTDTDKMELFSLIFKPGSKIQFCIDVFAEFISFVLNTLFAEDDHRSSGSFDAQKDSRGLSGSEQLQSVATVLSNPDTYQCNLLSNCLLQSLLKGDNPQAGILIRRLLIASSALLRLNLQTNRTTSMSSLVPLCFDICQVLLFKLANMSEVPKPLSFLWFDGVLSYLQELWCHFPSDIDSESSRNVYTSLIEMHLNALGMCISLQGKGATLSSYETDSRSKILCSEEGSFSHLPFFLDEFKARLRMSIKALFRKSSHFHMQSAVHVIKSALVGVNDGCAIIYNLNTGSPNGGKVSPRVAAGVDCFDLLVEYVSGGRKLDVSENIQGLMSALLNIVIHLQSPLIYYSVITGTIPKVPDPGAVILMSVEVLTRISGKHALLRMNSWHVAQTLRIPAVLFQDFCKVRESETFFSVDNQDSDIVVGQHALVDKQFLTALFGACCRLLSTTLRHHKSESEQCIALLQESVRVLLHCLETADSDLISRKQYFQIGVQEGVRCACSLRRIYEELRQHKEDFSQHCFKFLSDYILVYSGYGPLKNGVRREIDEALKPGVYALIDSCTADDLQHLHSVYGEGPCRNTLAALQHDYKLNFQYEGKV
ncbi:uncharacterized protein [Euphorbia lathyris]|uniref:uncharacterized protein n=1 Tax=Euphorbia lathyris TaxID=212925 RepID=UPI00331416AC